MDSTGQGSLLLRNTAFNVLGQAAPLALGVALFPFIVDRLGVDRFGILSLNWLLLTYLSLFDLGLGRSTTRFAAQALALNRSNRLPDLVWPTVLFQIALGLLGGALLFHAAPLLAGSFFKLPDHLITEGSATFSILAFAIPALLGTAGLRGALEAAQRFDLTNAVRAVDTAALFVFPALLLHFDFGLEAIVVALVLSKFGSALALFALSLRALPMLRSRPSVKLRVLEELLRYTSWVTISHLAGPVLLYLDRILLGVFVSAAAVSYYSVPNEVASRLTIIPWGAALSLFPVFTTLASSGSRVRLADVYARWFKYIVVVMGVLMITIALFARPILSVWLGDDFARESTAALQVVSLGVFIMSAASLPFGLLQAIGRPDLPAKFHLMELPVFVGLATVLVLNFGITGAAIAWTIRVALDAILVIAFSWRYVPGSLSAFARTGVFRAFGWLLGLTIAGWLTVTLIGSVVVQALAVIGFLGVFLWYAWLYLLDPHDRSALSHVGIGTPPQS